MEQIRSIFIGGKQLGANCLRELVKNDMRPELVIANSDDTGADTWHESLVRIAHEFTLPLIQGKKVKGPEVLEEMRTIAPSIIFCIGGMEIIPQTVLDIPPMGTINIHPALLPKYRGRFSIPHAIFNGEKETGSTLHYMDAGMDSGPIIAQKSFPLESDDTARDGYNKFTKTGTELFVDFIGQLKRGASIPSRPQDESQATYYPKGMPGDGVLDWSWDGEKIRRFIRAMTFEPFPPASFMLGTKKMLVVDEKTFTAQDEGIPSKK